jgi:hypothetical protein
MGILLQCSSLRLDFKSILDPVIVNLELQKLRDIAKSEEMPSWEKRHVLNQSAAYVENQVYDRFGT